MFTTRKRMSGWKVLRLRWTSYTVTPSHRYSPGGISLVTSCERTMVSSLSPSLSPRIMNPLPLLSSKKAALTVETPLSSRRSSSTRMVSPRENVSIIALPSEPPPPPRTHSSLPGEVWSIARPRASYSRELEPHEILGSLGRSKSQQLVSNSRNICSIRDEAEGQKQLSGAHLRARVGQRGKACYRELPRIPLPRTWVNRLASWALTNRPPRRISMGDNCIARMPNSRVAPGGGGPTRTFSERSAG